MGDRRLPALVPVKPRCGVEVLGCRVEISCRRPAPALAIEHVWGKLLPLRAEPDLSYLVSAAAPEGPFELARPGREPDPAGHLGELLEALDADLSVELQKLRRDLLFLHSGVISWGEKAILLVGDSGIGKSTTCWALSHLGAQYLSDEFAPIDLDDVAVLPYQRAIGLKREPPPGFPLPSDVLRTPTSLHLSLARLPGSVRRAPAPVGALVFLQLGRQGGSRPVIEEVSGGEAAARLYASALNALAHPSDGLEAVATIASTVPGFVLERGELGATCRLLRDTFGPASQGAISQGRPGPA